MPPEAFCRWLSTMKITGAAAARLLGVSPNAITRYKRKGTDTATALACAALYHRLEPWGDECERPNERLRQVYRDGVAVRSRKG
jgi:hypothetical protein